MQETPELRSASPSLRISSPPPVAVTRKAGVGGGEHCPWWMEEWALRAEPTCTELCQSSEPKLKTWSVIHAGWWAGSLGLLAWGDYPKGPSMGPKHCYCGRNSCRLKSIQSGPFAKSCEAGLVSADAARYSVCTSHQTPGPPWPYFISGKDQRYNPSRRPANGCRARQRLVPGTGNGCDWN